MPEGVEVCLISLFLNNKLKNKSITDIEILGGRYSRHSLKGFENFKHNLPVVVSKVNSKGKFLWFETEGAVDSYYILNTFGLEGGWGLKPTKHSSIRIEIDGKFNIYFSDSRNFGTMEITDSIQPLQNKLNSLGDDLLKTEFSDDTFFKRIVSFTKTSRREKLPIVKVLLEQKKTSGLGSGIGNYLVAEILYHSKISPHTTLGKLSSNKLLASKLSQSIKYIMKLSYMTSDIGYMAKMEPQIFNFIKDLRKTIKKNPNHKYNFHKNVDLKDDIFKFNVYRQKTDPCGYKIKGERIIKTRTTYWVEELQLEND